MKKYFNKRQGRGGLNQNGGNYLFYYVLLPTVGQGVDYLLKKFIKIIY